jgi:hypothetical protein
MPFERGNETMQDTANSEDTPEEASSQAAEVAQFVEYGIRSQMKDRPYLTMAAAFGIGYVLGGGMPRFAMRAIGAAGARYAANRFLKNLFNGS